MVLQQAETFRLPVVAISPPPGENPNETGQPIDAWPNHPPPLLQTNAVRVSDTSAHVGFVGSKHASV